MRSGPTNHELLLFSDTEASEALLLRINDALSGAISSFTSTLTSRVFWRTVAEFPTRFRADIANSENSPARLRQSMELLAILVGFAFVASPTIPGAGFLGVALMDIGCYAFIAEVLRDGNQAFQQRQAANRSQIFDPSTGILRQILNDAPNSFLCYFSEAAIDALKTKTSPASTADAISLLNHLFTQAALNSDLDAALVMQAQNQQNALLPQYMSSRGVYTNQAPNLVNPQNLIQALAYSHFIGTLQKARSAGGDTNHDLPDVNLDELHQKYEVFYDKFAANYEAVGAAGGREFIENSLYPILRGFAETGNDYEIETTAQNETKTNDIEAGIAVLHELDEDEIAPTIIIDTPRNRARPLGDYRRIVPQSQNDNDVNLP